MSTSPSTPLPIIHAYRALLRSTLHACQYAIPARYAARDTLRRAFRRSPASSYNPERISNTLQFLHYAAEQRGIEHKIVKNILHVRYWQWMGERTSWKNPTRWPVHWAAPEAQEGYRSFDRTIEMLNQTMGLCLK